MPLGLYISSRSAAANAATATSPPTFSPAQFSSVTSIASAPTSPRSAEIAEQIDAVFERAADSVYFGGGTPTVLDIAELERLFVTISQNFDVHLGSEITVECAPGTLTPALLDLLPRCGVNRVSLGAQSFIDKSPDPSAPAHPDYSDRRHRPPSCCRN